MTKNITIWEREGKSKFDYDLKSSLFLNARTIFITGEITTKMADDVVAQLHYLNMKGIDEPIYLNINSPGGYCTAGLAIYDTMQYLAVAVNTHVCGMACSMAAIILAGGTGERTASTNAEIMIHQPWGGTEGTETQMRIDATWTTRLRTRLEKILVTHTGLTYNKIHKLCEKDTYMFPEDALKLNLIDRIL